MEKNEINEIESDKIKCYIDEGIKIFKDIPHIGHFIGFFFYSFKS